eukprot:Skav220971  [mRNA]  locus=scaffold1928:552576:561785:- [translate_table: standard]
MGVEVQYRGLETGYNLGYTGHTQPAKELWPFAEPFFEVMDDVWNWLDGSVLIVWYLERMTSAAFPLDPMMLRLFRLSRLMRMVRLVKIFEQCDALYLMLTSIRASFAALAWSSALLLLIQMMLALAMVTIVEPYFTNPTATGVATEITLGNFVPVTRLMMQDVSEIYVVFALIHKLVIGFAVVMAA